MNATIKRLTALEVKLNQLQSDDEEVESLLANASTALMLAIQKLEKK